MWVPALNIFETSLRRGKFDESRQLSNGSLMEFEKVYPMDAVFDTLEDVPEDVRRHDVLFLLVVCFPITKSACFSLQQQHLRKDLVCVTHNTTPYNIRMWWLVLCV